MFFLFFNQKYNIINFKKKNKNIIKENIIKYNIIKIKYNKL